MSNEYSLASSDATWAPPRRTVMIVVVELPDDLRRPHPDRLPPETPGYEAIIAAHDAALAAGLDGYTDPRSGLFVMTAAYLWARGTCCDSGCRHCPYLRR